MVNYATVCRRASCLNLNSYAILITCEHAVNTVPGAYNGLFATCREILDTHHAYDIGAEEAAKSLADFFKVKYLAGGISRLLINLNRSPHNRRGLFSRLSNTLPRAEKENLLGRYYFTYLRQINNSIRKEHSRGRKVIHLSIHTFTPVRNGRVRNADIGLLYDPARPPEKRLCRYVKQALTEQQKNLRIRLNYPYRGVADGLTTLFRQCYSPAEYIGIELEFNQKYWESEGKVMGRQLSSLAAEALKSILQMNQLQKM